MERYDERIGKRHLMIQSVLVLMIVSAMAAMCSYALFRHQSVVSAVTAEKMSMTINNVNDMTVLTNSDPDYLKGVSVTGGKGNVRLSVNTSKVNMNQPGVYDICYTARDSRGRVVMKKAHVKVVRPTSSKVIYLTFDDGPSQNTPKILKILKKYKVKATFFVTGQEPSYFRYITKADQQGNFIAAHSYTHQFSIYRSEKTYFNDLDRIEKIIQKYTGHKSDVVRFPGGSSNTISRHYASGIMTTLSKDLLRRGYQYVDWNIDSTDASGNNVPVRTLVRNASSTYSDHLCLLMHDAGAKKTTVQALPSIIHYYQQRGYHFETLQQARYVFHHHINN